MKANLVILCLSSISGILFGLQAQGINFSLIKAKTTSFEPSPIGTIKTYASIDGVSEEELFANADLVFVGQVIEFVPSFWNRDNNTSPKSVQEWESTPSQVYHEVKLKVSKPIFGGTVGQIIKVYVPGASPIKSTLKIGPGSTFYAESYDSSLKIGSQGIFFLHNKDKIPWITVPSKTTFKTATTFSALGAQAYFPERNGAYVSSLNGEVITLESVQDKVRLYQKAREKVFRSRSQ